MKLSNENFIEQYIYCITEMQRAMLKDDYRTNNRYVLKLNKLIKKYENEDYYIEALSELIDNENLEVSSTASVESLRYNCNIDKAVRTLEKISSRKDTGIVGFAVGITLKRWKENGAEGIK